MLRINLPPFSVKSRLSFISPAFSRSCQNLHPWCLSKAPVLVPAPFQISVFLLPITWLFVTRSLFGAALPFSQTLCAHRHDYLAMDLKKCCPRLDSELHPPPRVPFELSTQSSANMNCQLWSPYWSAKRRKLFLRKVLNSLPPMAWVERLLPWGLFPLLPFIRRCSSTYTNTISCFISLYLLILTPASRL